MYFFFPYTIEVKTWNILKSYLIYSAAAWFHGPLIQGTDQLHIYLVSTMLLPPILVSHLLGQWKWDIKELISNKIKKVFFPPLIHLKKSKCVISAPGLYIYIKHSALHPLMILMGRKIKDLDLGILCDFFV